MTALYRSLLTLCCLALLLSSFVPANGATYTWQSAASTDWNVAGNWDVNGVPVDENGSAGLNMDNGEVIFAGTVMPTTNVPGIGGTNGVSSRDTPHLDLRSGGTLTVDYVGLDGSAISTEDSGDTPRAVLTIGNGVGGGTQDVALNVTGNLNFNRHGGGTVHNIAVNSDGTLNVAGSLTLALNTSRDSITDINGGTLSVGGNLIVNGDADTTMRIDEGGSLLVTGSINNAASGATIEFLGNGSLTAAFGGSFLTITDVNNAVGSFFIDSVSGLPTPGSFSVIDNGGTFTINASVPVPEPSTALILGFGLVGLVTRRRRGKTVHGYAAFVALLTAATFATPTQAAVLAYYNFDDGAGTVTDNSGNGATGTLNGGATYTAAGGGASGGSSDRGLTLVKASSQYVTLPGASFTSPISTSAMSLSLWTFGDASVFPAQTSAFYFGDAAGGAGRQFQSHLPWSNSNVFFDVAGGTGTSNRINKLATPAEFEGSWRHWTFVKSGTTSSIYLDGQLWHSGATSDTTFETINTAFIGRDPSATNFWDGEIDDFAVWDEGLSAEQAALIHGLDMHRNVAPNSDEIGDVLAAFNAGPGGAGIAGGRRWYFTTGLAGTQGATGTNGDFPFIVLDGAGNGVIALATVPEPTTLSMLALGLIGLTLRRRRLPLAIVVAFSISLVATSSQAGILAYYNFDKDAGTVADNSGNGATGTLNNGASFTASGGGQSGNAGDRAISFVRSSSQYMAIPPAAFQAMDTNNAASLSVWAFGDAAVLPANTTGFYFGTAAVRQFQTHLPWTAPPTATLYFDVAGGVTGGVHRIQQTAADANFEGSWAHWVFTKSGTTSTVYRNGQVWLTGTTSATDIGTIDLVTIGAGDSGANGWDGEMDDLAVWDEGLGADKVALLYGLDVHANAGAGLSSIDNVLAAFNAGAGNQAGSGGYLWKHTSGLAGPIGTIGGSIAGGDAFIVLDGSGNGVLFAGIPEPSTMLLLGMGLVGLTLRRNRSKRRWTTGRNWWTVRLKAEAERGREAAKNDDGISAAQAANSSVNIARSVPRIAASAFLLLAVGSVLADPCRAGTSGYEVAVLANNPVAYWRMEESGGTTNFDTAGVGPYNGTFTGSPVFQQPSPGSGTQRAVRFDPSDGADYSTIAGVPITASFSVELWAKSPTAAWNDLGWLASSRSNNGFILHPNSGTSWSAYHVSDAGAFTAIGSHAPADITDWHHYVMTFDDVTDTGIMYFDGVSVATNAAVGNSRLANDTISLTIGRDDGIARFGNGWIDEVAIYQSVLSPTDVLAHFQAFDSFVPEPSTALMLGIGLIGLAQRRRRVQRAGSTRHHLAAATVTCLVLNGAFSQAATLQLQLLADNYSPTTGAWVDASGMGNDAFQATAGDRPARISNATPNGMRSVVRFDGSNDHVDLPNFLTGFAAGEAFIVVKTDNDVPAAAQSGLWSFGSAPNATHYSWTDGIIYEDFGNTTRYDTGNSTLTLDEFRVYNVSASSGLFESFIDNVQHYTGGNTVGWTTAPLLGQSSGAFFLDGDIAEIRLYEGTLTAGERDLVYAELLQSHFQTPEPSTALMLGIGLLGLTIRRRRPAAKSRVNKKPNTVVPACLTLLLALLSTSIATATKYSNLVLADGATTYWQLEETTGTTVVDSAGSANGAYFGSPILNQPGAAIGTQNAVQFVPTGDYGQVGSVPITASFSVEMWARSNTANWNDNGWLASERQANGFLFHPNAASGDWRAFVVNSAGGLTQIGLHNANGSGNSITDWHQYAITFDDATDTGRMYFDGQLVAENTGMTLTRSALANIQVEFGRDDGSGTRFGDGWIDDISIYQTALTASQVADHFSIRNLVPEPSTALLSLMGLLGLATRRR